MSQIPEILQDLYLKNLAFFKKQNLQIHDVITKTKPDHSNIFISDSGKIDLKYNGRTIYGGDAISYAEKEVETFKNIYQSGIRVNSINAVVPDSYSAPRFFHRHLNQTVIDMYKKAETVEVNVINQGNRHDLLIACGIGIGLHLTELVEKVDVQNLIILETDFELLTLSCFFTDWSKIYEIQSTKNNKSITFLLMNNRNHEIEQGSLWNELIKRAPHFPYNTVFYNHGRHSKYGDIIRKITSDIRMFVSLWGFYDDEVNQLNHILHNVNKGLNFIPKKGEFFWNKPIIICGSGPSLDSRMNQLKSIRKSCILITAGTSLPVLLKNDLKPDFHIEIESDYSVYNSIKSSNSLEDLKEITLISAVQCSPYISTLFKENYSFVKDSLSIGDLLVNQKDKLREPTPTCVNAALSIAFQYNAPEIFLFGTDFGFYDRENHHSKDTIYVNENLNSDSNKKLKQANKSNMDNNFEREGYLGTCLTTSLYFTTKRRVEMAIRINKIENKSKIFNCSDGLIIDNTTHIKESDTISINNEEPSNKIDFINKTYSIDKNLIHKLNDNLLSSIDNLCKVLVKNIKPMELNTYSLSALSWAISNYIDTTFQEKNGSITFFIRGTIWHYLLSGYSISYASKIKKQAEVIGVWKEGFIDFLEKLPNDLKNSINKERSTIENDTDLKRTIKE